MALPDLSGGDVVRVLRRSGVRVDRCHEIHVVLIYRHPETEEVQTVTVPLHETLVPGTLRSIAKQAGAGDFREFVEWIDQNR